MAKAKKVPAKAIGVLRTFLDASLKADEGTMRGCLTKQSVESGQFSGGPQGVTFEIGEGQMEEEKAVVGVKATPVDAAAGSPPVMEMDCILVKEEGEWKVDLIATMERMMGGSLDAAMGQIAEGMGQALQGVTDALAEGMSAAFGSSGMEREISEEEKGWDTASMEVGTEELKELPELTFLPKATEAVSAAFGEPVKVEADFAGLLRTVGSDDAGMLTEWFENTLFADWQNVFSQAIEIAGGRGKIGAISGVRLEGTQDRDGRLLIADGSTVVYRLFLNNTDGYFSDLDILVRLPGILAGLPAAVEPEGRQVPTEEEYPEVEFYRTHAVPRWMRRIRELMGKAVELEADWGQIGNWNSAGRVLPIWGLNRVYGALKLAMVDEEFGAKLRGEFRKIGLSVGSVNKEVRYEDGGLEVGISGYSGADLGSYEFEILNGIRGEEIQMNPE